MQIHIFYPYVLLQPLIHTEQCGVYMFKICFAKNRNSALNTVYIHPIQHWCPTAAILIILGFRYPLCQSSAELLC